MPSPFCCWLEGLAPARSSLGPSCVRPPLGSVPSLRLLAPITMASAITTDARSPFCSPQEDPFLLLESAQKAIEGILRCHAGRPLRRTWIEQPYGEEEICLLEEEVLPAIERCIARVEEIDQALQSEQEIEIRHAGEEAAWERAALMAEAGRAGMGY